MRDPLSRLASLWIGRNATPDAAALAGVAHLRPAVVVTGGSEGIGLALAERFARGGAIVVLVARRPQVLDAAAAGLRARGLSEVHTIALDVTIPDAPDRLEKDLSEQGLYGDILVNNAGIGLGGDFAGHGEADLAALIDCNVRAHTLLMRRLLVPMLQRGRGGILNVASLGGLAPGPCQAAYYASKAYVLSLTAAVRWETRGRGVRIAALAPGPVDTAFHARMGAQSSPYRQLMPQLTAAFVARLGYRGFSWGMQVIFPGILATLLALALWIVPNFLTVPIIGRLLRPGKDQGRGRGGDAR